MVATATLLCLTGLLTPPISHLQQVNEEWRTHTASDPLQLVNEEWRTHSAESFQKATTTTLHVHQAQPSPSTVWDGTVEQWRPLVAEHFPPDQVATAMCVLAGESGGSPTAKNPRSSAAGLWQFLRHTWDVIVPREVTGGSYDSGAVYDPVASTRAAAWLWANLGWSQWSAYARCH